MRVLLLLLITAVLVLAGADEQVVRFQLPDSGSYRMTVSTTESGKSNGKPTSRTSRIEAKVRIVRDEEGGGGHRMQIDYVQHNENVNNRLPSADLRGVSLVYRIAPDGTVVSVEGLEELVRRINSGVQQVAPSLAPETARAQFLYLREHCELLAAHWAGKALQPGEEWNDTRAQFAGGLTPRPVTQKLKVSAAGRPCGLGECVELEGTYQNNITEDAKRLIHAIIDDNPPDSRLPVGGLVNAAWETGRVSYSVHAETGLLARIAYYSTSFTEILSGSKVNREERVRSSELILDDENRLKRAPLKASVVGSID